MLPDTIADFAGLIRWLAAQHHRGSYYRMALGLDVSVPLVYQWKNGAVKHPSRESLDRLCMMYGLDLWDVMALVWKLPSRPGRGRTGGANVVPLPAPDTTLGASDQPDHKPPSDNGRGHKRRRKAQHAPTGSIMSIWRWRTHRPQRQAA